jgi:hypothetical protein
MIVDYLFNQPYSQVNTLDHIYEQAYILRDY